MATFVRDNQEGSPRDSQSQNSTVPRINEEYITQMSEEVEGRLTKRLTQEFNRTERQTWGALSELVEFHLNLQI